MLKAILQVAGEKNVRNQYCMSHSHLVLMIFLSLYLPTVQALAHFQQIASHSSVFIYLCFVFVLPSICISNAGALLPLLPRSWATLFISFFWGESGPQLSYKIPTLPPWTRLLLRSLSIMQHYLMMLHCSCLGNYPLRCPFCIDRQQTHKLHLSVCCRFHK